MVLYNGIWTLKQWSQFLTELTTLFIDYPYSVCSGRHNLRQEAKGYQWKATVEFWVDGNRKFINIPEFSHPASLVFEGW